jgi:SAM-dependent methyltransferase
MFVVQYARSIELWMDFEMKGFLCHYLFSDNHQHWECSQKRLEELLPMCVPGKFIYLATNLRIPSMDGKETIRNRFAYVNLVMRNTGVVSLGDFFKSILLIRGLKELTGLPTTFVEKLEALYWSLAPPSVKAWCKNTVKRVLLRMTEKMYAPDYVWKSQGNKTTVQLLQDKKSTYGIAQM